MALNEAKYYRLADLQTLKQTNTMRQAKRRSLQPASRLSSSTFSNKSGISKTIAEVEGDSYNAPIIEINGPASRQCAACKRSFSLLVPPQPCMLACGKLYCSTCASQVCGGAGSVLIRANANICEPRLLRLAMILPPNRALPATIATQEPFSGKLRNMNFWNLTRTIRYLVITVMR